MSTTLTRACTFTRRRLRRLGLGADVGQERRLPRITTDRSWLGNTPCGLFVFTGSVAGLVESGQKMKSARAGLVAKL